MTNAPAPAAIAATTLSSSTTRYHVILSQDAGMSMAARQRLAALVQGMMAKGADMYTATSQARRVLDGIITRQAAMLAYNHVFGLVSSLFVLGFPLVFLLRRGSPGEDVETPVD